MQTKQTVKQENTFSNHRNGFERAVLASNLSSLQKLIALILKSHMNNTTGLCNPSIKTLMAKGSMSKGTVKNCIDALEVAGFISKITGNGRGNSNSYTLNIIESDVDNRNKHKGNTQNLEPNYSYDLDVNPEDFPQVDFDDEHHTLNTLQEMTSSKARTLEAECYPDHLEILENIHRISAERNLTSDGYYFNEHYRKHLDSEGRPVTVDLDDF